MLKKILSSALFILFLITTQQAFCQDSLQVKNIADINEYFGQLNVQKDSFSLEKGKRKIVASPPGFQPTGITIKFNIIKYRFLLKNFIINFKKNRIYMC